MLPLQQLLLRQREQPVPWLCMHIHGRLTAAAAAAC
jgi:hypothetical protein